MKTEYLLLYSDCPIVCSSHSLPLRIQCNYWWTTWINVFLFYSILLLLPTPPYSSLLLPTTVGAKSMAATLQKYANFADL
jgi:hypothetical protein